MGQSNIARLWSTLNWAGWPTMKSGLEMSISYQPLISGVLACHRRVN